MPKFVNVVTIEPTLGRRNQAATLLVAHKARCLKDEPGTLWAGSDRSMARGSNLCRSNSTGREAWRTPGSETGQVRVGNQPQSRQRDRIEHRARIAAPRQ